MKITLENNQLFNEGELIGTYDPDRNVLHMPKRFSPKLYKPIEAAVGRKPEYDFGAPNPLTEIHNQQGRQVVSQEVHNLPRAGSNPAPATILEPPQDPRYGDKTIEWAQWLKDTDPKAFEARFKGRNITLE